MKTLIAIYALVVISGAGTVAYVDHSIDALVVKHQVQGYELQPAARVNQIQPTVSDAYLQWGENPQKTAPASVLDNTNATITVN